MPMYDTAGDAFVGWFGTLTDIDALKRAESALRESDARHRAFSDALPGIAWSATPDGKLEFIGKNWAPTRGRPVDEALGDAWIESIHPDDRVVVLQMWNASLASGQMYDTQFRTLMADGSYRWHLVRALPVCDDAGAIVRWVGVNIDIDDRRRADAARETFVALAENSSDFTAILDDAGTFVYINEAGRALVGLAATEEIAGFRLGAIVAGGDGVGNDEQILAEIHRVGRWRGDVAFRHRISGATVAVEFNAFTIYGHGGESLGLAIVSRDRRERDRVESGLRLLSRTGAAALDSLDYALTLKNIARVCVEEFASYCIIDVRDTDDRWERTSAHHSPVLQRVVENLSEPPAQHPIRRALDYGESSLNEVDSGWVLSIGGSEDRESAVRALDVRSFITVPVITPAGAIIGALTCALDGTASRSRYCQDDLAFVDEVGRRAGAAIANARIFARERRIAVELQAASLPTSLPRFPGLTLDADYRPGSDEATIGGDWYDAFEIDDGRIVMTVGDVLGHGLHAAVTMTKLRQAMQAAAMMHPDPCVMLAVAEKTLHFIDPDGYATALAAIYDVRVGTLTYASAGHPGPAIRGPSGDVTDGTNSGLMLGVRDNATREVRVVSVDPGAMAFFYTDGLIESTRDVDVGLRRLHDALAAPDLTSLDTPARTLVDRILGGGNATDDIAMLVARF